jgi:hypothetical protein
MPSGLLVVKQCISLRLRPTTLLLLTLSFVPSRPPEPLGLTHRVWAAARGRHPPAAGNKGDLEDFKGSPFAVKKEMSAPDEKPLPLPERDWMCFTTLPRGADSTLAYKGNGVEGLPFSSCWYPWSGGHVALGSPWLKLLFPQ